MDTIHLLLYILILSGYIVLSQSDLCSYDETTSSQYVKCLSITQRPPYACESDGGSKPDSYQIHILETDLDRMETYNATVPPEIIIIIKPWKGPVPDTSQTIVLVFHAFEPVIWRVYSEHFPVGTNFIIKSSHPLIIDPTSILVKTQVELISILPKDSESVIRTIESLFDQRVTSFSGFHEGSRITWSVGPGKPGDDSPCTIMPLSLTQRIQIFKEIPVATSGCTVPPGLGYNTHIVDIGSTHDSNFGSGWRRHVATLIVKSKVYNEEFYGSNVVIILKSKKTIEWTIDTSAMDGRVMVVTNGKSQTPNQSNLNVNIVGIDELPDKTPQEFINYVSRTYGAVASYTKAEIANQVIIEVPEVVIHTSHTNVTEPPRTEPPPDIDEIVAAIDGQKTVNCYREKVTVSWSLMLLERLSVEDVFFTEDTQGTDDCGLQMIASQGTLLSSYDQCGFTASHQEFSSVYEAKITVVLKDGRSREISVQCRIYNTTKMEDASIDSLYRLSIYDNVDFETEIKSFNVTHNGYVYFKANLEEISDPNMSAVVEECFVSPTRDNILDRHVLISQTCPLDSSIHFLNQNIIGVRDERCQKIKFRISNYFMNSNNYFLHCKVSMCSNIITPDIPRCASLYQMCKRDPPDPRPNEAYPEILTEYEQQYILAGPIYLHNYTTGETPTDIANVTDGRPCKDIINTAPRGRNSISMGLLIGIALGSFALGIIVTVFTIHCVSLSKSRTKVPPTDVFRFENRQVENLYEPSNHMYEPIKLYDVCPQGHHLNRTTDPEQSAEPV